MAGGSGKIAGRLKTFSFGQKILNFFNMDWRDADIRETDLCIDESSGCTDRLTNDEGTRSELASKNAQGMHPSIESIEKSQVLKSLLTTIWCENTVTNDKEEAFEKWLLENDSSFEVNMTYAYSGKTLLEYAMDHQLPRMAKTLIDRGADLNKQVLLNAIRAGEQYFNLILRAAGGSLDITQKFKFEKTILHYAVHTDNANSSVNVVESILELVEKKIVNPKDVKKWIDQKDTFGLTALHYAAKRGLNGIVEVLLKKKANIFAPDLNKVPVILSIRPEIIMKHLDEQIHYNFNEFSNEEHTLEFDFNFLKVPKKNQKSLKAASKEMHSCVNMDVAKDTTKDIDEKDKSENEMQPLQWMVDSESHRILLQHPIIKAFLYIKWNRLFWFYWLNFAFYFAFAFFFFIFIISIDFKNFNNEGMVIAKNQTESVAFPQENFDYRYYTLMVLTVFFALRELFQIVFLGKNYFLNLENWLEMTIIVMIMCLLHSPFTKWLASTLCLLICIEMVLLISRHPCMAIYIRMFFQVALNFTKFFLWYTFLIAAFAFSFYIVFPYKCTSEDGKEKCKDFFNTLPNSIFKTMIMISGEFETGEMEFNHASVASHVIFLSFLFLISIVMVNLLNGLAVSDTQQILNKADLIYCVSQVKFFFDIESFLGYLKCFCRSFVQSMGTKIILLDNLLGNENNVITVYLSDNYKVKPDLRYISRDDGFLGFIGAKIPFEFQFGSTFKSIVSEALIVKQKSMEDDKYAQILTELKKQEARLLDKIEKMIRDDL
ncbi:transient receptor potential cation channel protein painless-like [Neocloeon triangulifer]|uniref:transient receptor potential cation channel protein painless-like n=1 Tax=Neocloeon triangulifer TaxID=2078957 RepID=UPI00286EDCA8|nr:transient receptor potential cation channel protein painless-like [Neocloeon triangulifer]